MQVIENKINLKLWGELTLKDFKTGEIIQKVKNQITTIGVTHWIENGLDSLTFVAVGSGSVTASESDTKLVAEITRYSIDEIIYKNGEAIILTHTDDRNIYTAQEWGLFYNQDDKTASARNSGILFSRVVSEKQRLDRQKLTIEWRIGIS
jgi:hypothetical protein